MFVPNTVNIFGSKIIYIPYIFEDISHTIGLQKSRIKALSQPSEPCNEIKERSSDTGSCIANFIQDKIKCSIKIHGAGLNKHPSCNKRSQIQDLLGTLELLKYADAKTIENLTGCLASCDKYEYKILFNRKTNFAANYYCAGGNSTCHMSLMLQINEMSYEEKKQYVVYDINSFIADVGGFMGLLLGFSILGLYDELANLLRRFKLKRMAGGRALIT